MSKNVKILKGNGIPSEIRHLMKVALDENALLKALNNKVKIISYSDLKNIHDIDDLLYPHNKVIILFAIKGPLNGHWTCLFKQKNGSIQFFDSFGLLPMDENKYMSMPYSIEKYVSDQFKPYIYELFSQYPDKIRYNQYKLQDFSTSVCGRYCVVRLQNPELSEDEFSKELKSTKYHPDVLVTLMTKNI